MTASQYLFDSDFVDFAVSVASVVSSQLFPHGRDRTPVRREGWNQQAVGVDDRLSQGQITVMIFTAFISHPDRAVLFVDRAGVESLTGRTRTAAEQEFDGCELRQRHAWRSKKARSIFDRSMACIILHLFDGTRTLLRMLIML